MSFHHNYWSCSKFADWIRGDKKLGAATSEDWAAWTKTNKLRRPIRYWLAEEGLTHLQDFVYWPANRIQSIKYYINNRWITRTHGLTATSLKPGVYYELETRILHSMFDELVNFVEIEEAWMQVIVDKEAAKKYRPPWWATGRFRIRSWRSAEAGLAQLNWAASLVFDEDWDKDKEYYMQPTPQAVAAKEVLDLYDWWCNRRPLRPDPLEVSGWSKICEKRRLDNPDEIMPGDKTDEEKIQSTQALERLRTIEEQYNQEDEDMLIRLIKIRQNLWA